MFTHVHTATSFWKNWLPLHQKRFIYKLEFSLSDYTKPKPCKPSTSKSIKSNSTPNPRESAIQVAPSQVFIPKGIKCIRVSSQSKTNSKIVTWYWRMKSWWSGGFATIPYLSHTLEHLQNTSHPFKNANIANLINNWTMATELIQWNCRGLKANFNEFHLFLASQCLYVIYL